MSNKQTDLIKCISCGQYFHPGYLDQVAAHIHNNVDAPEVRGKRIIKDASEVYPNCDRKFACGVHSYLKGENYPTRPESDEFIQGYYAAERDLNNNYTLEL